MLPPGTELNEYIYGYLAINLGEMSDLQPPFVIDNLLVRIIFWGQQSKGPFYIPSNTIYQGIRQQQYEIRCPMIMFVRYLEEGIDLVLEFVDRRNSKVIGNSIVRWPLYIRKQLKDSDMSPLHEIDFQLPIMQTQQLQEKIIEILFYFSSKIFQTRKREINWVVACLNQLSVQAIEREESLQETFSTQIICKGKSSKEVATGQINIDELQYHKRFNRLDSSISQMKLMTMSQVLKNSNRSQYQFREIIMKYRIILQLLLPLLSTKNKLKEQLEIELLRLQDDAALLFPAPYPKQGQYQESAELEIAMKGDVSVLNLRNVDSLSVTVKKFTLMPVGEKLKERFKDHVIQAQCKIPMVRGKQITQQTFIVSDTHRGPNNSVIYFNSQLKSNLSLSEDILSQFSQAQLQFRIFMSDISEFELGSGEFQMQTMILDGVREFTYDVEIKQSSGVKKQPNAKVLVGLLTVAIQLGGLGGTSRQDRPTQQQQQQQQESLEEQIKKLKEELQLQIVQQMQDQGMQRQQQEDEDISQLLGSMQLFLNVERLVEYEEQEQLSLKLRTKQYGFNSEKVESETQRGQARPYFDLRLICPVTMSSLNKMETLPWMVELWGVRQHSHEEVLIGVSKLYLNQIYSAIMEQASPSASLKFMKTNLFPMIIYDGDVASEDIRSQQVTGILRCRLAFGSVSQIGRYQNTVQRQQQQQQEHQQVQESIVEEIVEDVIPQQHVQEPPHPSLEENQYPHEILQALLQVLNQLSTNPTYMPTLPRSQFLPSNQFKQILNQLCGKFFDQSIIQFVENYLMVDPEQADWSLFSSSWSAFTAYKSVIRDVFTQTYQQLYTELIRGGICESINQFERILMNGDVYFGLLDRQDLRDTMLQLPGDSTVQPSGPSLSAILVEQVLTTLEVNDQNQVFLPSLFDYLRSIELFGETRNVTITMGNLVKVVEDKIRIWGQGKLQQIQQLSLEDDMNAIDAKYVISLFEQLELSVSLLDSLALLESIYQTHGIRECSQSLFWKYLIDLITKQVEEIEGNEINEINEIAGILSNPVYDRGPQQLPIGKRIVEDVIQSTTTLIRLDLLHLTSFNPPQLNNDDQFSIHVLLYNTDHHLQSSPFNYQANSSQYALSTQCLFYLPSMHTNKDSSLLFIIYSLNPSTIVAQGTLAIEEFMQLSQATTFYIPLFDKINKNDSARIQIRIELASLPQPEIERSLIRRFDHTTQTFIDSDPQHQSNKLSMSQILEKLRPENLHTFSIRINTLQWYSQIKSNITAYQVIIQLNHSSSLSKTIKQAIPEFKSDQMPYSNNNLNLQIEYQVKCDQILANQIANLNLKVQLILFNQSKAFTYIGFIPLNELVQSKVLEGEIPLDIDGQFGCTLNVLTTYTNDGPQQQQEELEPIQQKQRILRKTILRVLELINLDFNKNLEIGELYFMLVSPLHQSESYQLRSQCSSILNTEDCIFVINPDENTVELQVRSVYLGEDRLLGRTSINITQLFVPSIQGEANYLYLDTSASLQWLGQSCMRIGIKIINICYDQDSLNPYSLNQIFRVFEYDQLKAIQRQQNEENLRDVLKKEVQLSYSEINFLMNLIKPDQIQTIFSNKIMDLVVKRNEDGQEQPRIADILQEFLFYDSEQMGFIDPIHFPTVLRYFNMEVDQLQLISSKCNRRPLDVEVRQIQKQNHLDYVVLLALLQKTLPTQLRPYFVDNLDGPIQHKMEDAIRNISPVKHELIESVNIHIIGAKGLNRLLPQNRHPNSILVIPSLQLQTNIAYSQANPSYDVRLQVKSNDKLVVQIFDKRYNSADVQQIYTNVQIGICELSIQELVDSRGRVLDIEIKSTLGQQPAILQVQQTNEQQPMVSEQKVIRNLFNQLENIPVKDNENDQNFQNQYQDEVYEEQDHTTLKNIEDNLQSLVDQLLRQPRQQQPEQPEKSAQPGRAGKPGQGELPIRPAAQRPPQIYQSSSSSSQPSGEGGGAQRKGTKSTSSERKLRKIEEELPRNVDEIRRIEGIMRRNNIDLARFQDSSDSD